MFRISRDTPALYITSVATNRLPVFRKSALKDLACEALAEARISAGSSTPSGLPAWGGSIIGSELKPSKVVQYINGIIGRRVIDYVKANGHDISLSKLRHEERSRGYRYSLWDHHPNTKRLTHEDVFMQKVHYFIRIRFAPAWLRSWRTIAGQALGAGCENRWRMNR